MATQGKEGSMLRETYLYDRSRVSESAPLHTRSQWYQMPGGPETKFEESQVWADYSLKQFGGMNTPRYHRRKRAGELLSMHPYEYAEIRQHTDVGYDLHLNVPGGMQRWWSVGNIGSSAPLITVESLGDLWPTANEQYYVHAAAAKIYGNSHDTFTFLAELPSLLRMFKALANRFANLHRLRLAYEARSAVEDRKVSALWLEWRYGWRTFLLDLESFMKALDIWNSKRTRFSEKAGTKWTTGSTESSSTIYSGWTLVKQTTIHTEVGLRGSVIADAYLPPFQFSVLTTAWEKIPYSFVVDWFLRVGTWLNAMNFLNVQLKHFAAVGVYIMQRRTVKYSSLLHNAGSYGAYTGEALCEGKLLVRQPTTISFYPQFKLSIDAFKIADLLALIAQFKRSNPLWRR